MSQSPWPSRSDRLEGNNNSKARCETALCQHSRAKQLCPSARVTGCKSHRVQIPGCSPRERG